MQGAPVFFGGPAHSIEKRSSWSAIGCDFHSNWFRRACRSRACSAKQLGCSDVSVIASRSDDSQVRFSNNAITLVSNVRNITLDLYLAKSRKRIVGQTYNPTVAGITRFIENLVSSCETLPASEDYFPLPEGPFHYEGQSNFDPKVKDASLVQYVKQAIDSGEQAGAKRVSGSLNTETTDFLILTSAGASGRDKQSKMLLNVRAFADDDASGHGLSALPISQISNRRRPDLLRVKTQGCL